MSEADVIKTGIDGLDQILQGGIPRSNTILVQGVAGTGKTLMGIEFIFQGISQYDEPGLIVVFETSPDKLVRDAAQFGWNLDELQDSTSSRSSLPARTCWSRSCVRPIACCCRPPSRWAPSAFLSMGSDCYPPAIPDGGHSPLSGPGSYRELLLQLMEGLHRQNLTAMLSHETGSLEQSLATLESAGFLADTLIELTLNRQSRSGQRSIEIIKSRGQEYISGQHTLRITSKKGLEVFRRAQAPVNRTWGQPTSNAKGSVAGVQTLDDLIGGGLFDGSTTMVIGISGVGKTVLATQLLREGIVNEGKRGLLVSLDEHPAQIIRNSHTLGFDLQKHLDSGMLRVFYESPQELEIDSHFARIVKTVEDNDIQRMVIDGVTSYSTALNDHQRYRDFFHAVVAYSKSRLMTTVFTYENAELFGISSYMPEFPVSSIVDNIILMSLVEFGSTLHRCMAVVKARGCKHEFDTREFVIGEGGISLLPMDKSAELPALPIESYSSILSRAPTRTGVARGTARAAKGGK